MQPFVIRDGEKLIPLKVAALSSRLTRNYISKLCRRGDVLGALIEGSWYVGEKSLQAFVVKKAVDKANWKRRQGELRKQEQEEAGFDKNVEYALPNVAALGAGLSPDYITRLCRSGVLNGKQVNGVWYVHQASLATFLSSSEKKKEERKREQGVARKTEQQLAGFDANANSERSNNFPFVRASPQVLQYLQIEKSVNAIRAVQKKTLIAGTVVLAVAVIAVSSSVPSLNSRGIVAAVSSDLGPIPSFMRDVYRALCPFFSACDDVPTTSNLAVTPVPFKKPIAAAATSTSVKSSPSVVQTITRPARTESVERIVERTTERVVQEKVLPTDVVTKVALTRELDTFAASLLGEFIRLIPLNIPTSGTLAPTSLMMFAQSQVNNNSGASSVSTFPTDPSFTSVTSGSLSASGAVTFDSLNGPLQAIDGVISATTTIGTLFGGTGFSNYSVGDILYANTPTTLAKLPAGTDGRVLKVSGGIPSWGTDVSGSGGSSAWATTTDNLAVYTTDPAQAVLLGSSATTTMGNIFEVRGASLFRGGVTAYNTLTAPLFTATSTTGTSTFANLLISGALGIGSDYVTDITGPGLTISGGILGADFTNTNFFSTTSADYLASQRSFFSTTSSDYWKAQNIFFSTTSADYLATQRNQFSTSSTNYWKSVTDLFSTTSSNYLLSTYDKGFFFSTTSADYWKTVNNFFATTSADFWKSGTNFFSTTSADYLATQRNFFSTSSSDYWKSITDIFSTTSASFFANASTSIPKTYTANAFTALQTFNSASTTAITATNASTTNLVVSSLTSGLLKTGPTGIVALATPGTDYVTSTGGDWTGTLNNYTAPQIIAAGFSTTSADYWKTQNIFFATTSSDYLATQRNFFSTSSASYFLAQNQNSAFSTSSATYLLATYDKGYFFSTTSASAFILANQSLTFATTSADYWKTANNFFSTTSANFWVSGISFFSTTSADYLLATYDKGFFFSTTSSDFFVTKRSFFSTTSTDYWKSLTDLFSTTSAIYFANASTTIPKTYTNNYFATSTIQWIPYASSSALTAGNLFANSSIVTDATTTSLFTATASTSRLFVTGLGGCSAGYYLTWANGAFGCAQDQAISGSAPFAWSSNFGTTSVAATSSSIWSQGVFFSSSTVAASQFPYASSTAITTEKLFTTNATTTYLGIGGLTNALLSTDANGTVIATTSLVSSYLSGIDKGFYFSTSSVDGWKLVNNFFATTSADYLATQRNFFSTTSASNFLVQNQSAAFSTTSANYFIDASTTIAKTYSANTFTALQTFNYASTTAITATTASTTGLVISNAGGTGTRCLQVGADGTVSANSSACGTGGGGADFTFQSHFGSTAITAATSSPALFTGALYASSTVQFGAAGRSQFFLDTTGRLGLGTTTPFATLQIATTTGRNLVLTDPNAGTDLKHWLFSSQRGNLYVGTTTDAYSTSTPSALSISNAGLVTIANLLATASSTIGGGAQTTGLTVSGGATTTGLLNVTSTGTSTFSGNLDVLGALKVGNSSLYVTNTSIQNLSGNLLIQQGGNNVGIGTTSPVSKLSVLGASALAGGVSVGTGFAGVTPPTGGLIVEGNVGIGTTSPQVRLHVSGTGGELLRLETTTADNDPYVSFYTNTTRHGYLQYNDTTSIPGMILNSESGGIQFSTSGGFAGGITSAGMFTLGQTTQFGNGFSLLDTGSASFGASDTNPAGNNTVGVFIHAVNGWVSANGSGATSGIFGRTADGGVISIQSAGSAEGTISVSGTTVTYGAFTGSHYASTSETISRGELVEFAGTETWKHGDSNSEPTYDVVRSTTENSPSTLGSMLSLLEPTQPLSAENPYLVMAVGNGDMWVVDNGEDLAPGDYLISSAVAGHAMKDPGTHPVSHIVARVAERVEWSTISSTTAGGIKHRKISVTFGQFDKLNGFDLVAASLASTSSTTTQEAELFVDKFFDGLFARLTKWFALAGNGISDFFAKNIHAENVFADTLTANKTLCVGKTCVSEDQLIALLAGQTAASGTAGDTGDSSSNQGSRSAASTAPIVQINGNNPATISVGEIYLDLGATITGPTSALNLSITTLLDGATTTEITIDTSVASEHTVSYIVTDAAGLTSTAERRVHVVALTPTPSITEASSTPPIIEDTPLVPAVTDPPETAASTTTP